MESPEERIAEEPLKEEKGDQPFYEFPANDPLQNESTRSAPVTSASPEIAATPSPPDEVVSPSMVYPPPPSFYQNMQVPSERPPLPAAQEPINRHIVPAHANYPAQPPVYSPGIQTTSPPFAPPFAAQPPVKRSRKWLWFVIAILSGALIASCGLCGWGFYNIFNTTVQQVTGSLKVVNDYYNNLQAKNYDAAYRDDLALSNGPSQREFVQQAQARDAQYGPITSYSPGQPSFSSDPTAGQDFSHVRYVVDVARGSFKYTVLLTVGQVKGKWVITSFDAL